MGVSAALDHPAYEMSSRMSSRHKDPGASIGEVVSTHHRLSRHSWSLLTALDRSFRTLFVRESTPRETGTIDVEVSFSSAGPPAVTEVENVRLRFTPRRTLMLLLFMRVLELKRSWERPRSFPGPRITCVPSERRTGRQSKYLPSYVLHPACSVSDE